jgi:hypothetical protein
MAYATRSIPTDKARTRFIPWLADQYLLPVLLSGDLDTSHACSLLGVRYPKEFPRMDGHQFDDLSRRFSNGASRRGVLLGLTGALLAAGAAIMPVGQEGEAKRRRRRRKKGKNASPPPPPPSACVPNCAGKNCGPDGCGNSCGECVGGQACTGGACTCQQGQEFCGGQCRNTCASALARNPITCACCVPVGLGCGFGADCCTGADQCFGGSCRGGDEGNTCQFDDQCQQQLTCQNGRCEFP